jgi:hypothetical protein
MSFLQIVRYVSASAFAVLAAGTVALSADARANVAMSGAAVNPSDATCFSESAGSVTNICSGGARPFMMPPPSDWAATYNVIVSAQGPTVASNVCCNTIGVDKNGSVVSNPPTTCLGTFGTPTDLHLNGSGIPGRCTRSAGSIRAARSTSSTGDRSGARQPFEQRPSAPLEIAR